MSKWDLLNDLRESFESSTETTNLFARAIDGVAWDYAFEDDGVMCYIIGDVFLSTPSTDPFSCDWKPSVAFMDTGFQADL